MSISDNIAVIQRRIAAAASHAGRDPDEIALMAVTKTQSTERIRQAYAAGLRLFGENRVQEFSAKAESLADLGEAEWHMIGHLQSNKAVKTLQLFQSVDSVDSVRLAEKLNAAAQNQNKTVSVLIEVNVGGEEAKSGVLPESRDFENLLIAAPRFSVLRFRGLMTVPPFTEDPEGSRPYFRKLRDIRDAIRRRTLPAIAMDVLSMGMSHDFEVAIEEGSTCVRVGTAIFGERPKP
ncbi:MAG TPA: YggS family pyridoxal phosphate-dependent enzyme [Candidatus Sulfotelmatobacter sp.]